MDPGFRTPLLDYFRRGDVPRDVRLLAARGVLAPRAHEQLALLVMLLADPDPEVAGAAAGTIDGLPREALAAFLARSDVSDEMRTFFGARGVEPAASAADSAEAPLVETASDGPEGDPASPDPEAAPQREPQLSTLAVPERLKLAMRGTREQRAMLIRDSNKLVAVAVLSCPKLSDSEVEGFSRMANVSEEVLRIIGTSRAWTKSYTVTVGLVRNPKTPPAISLGLVSRLNDRDVRGLSVDRNVPEAVRIAARKVVAAKASRRG